MPKQVIKYQCSFCKRIYSNEWRAKWHEENRCTRNPSQMACMTCEHFHGVDGRWDDATTEYIDSTTKCTNYSVPFQYHCEKWNKRTENWKYWIPKQ